MPSEHLVELVAHVRANLLEGTDAGESAREAESSRSSGCGGQETARDDGELAELPAVDRGPDGEQDGRGAGEHQEHGDERDEPALRHPAVQHSQEGRRDGGERHCERDLERDDH